MTTPLDIIQDVIEVSQETNDDNDDAELNASCLLLRSKSDNSLPSTSTGIFPNLCLSCNYHAKEGINPKSNLESLKLLSHLNLFWMQLRC